MEFSSTNKRSDTYTRLNISLYTQLVILLRNHKELKYVCTSSSLAFRIICLCDLVIDGNIYIENGFIKIKHIPKNPILHDFTNAIAQKQLEPYRLIKTLNGERGRENSIKHLKSKIYRELERQDFIEKISGSVFNKIIIKNSSIWLKIHTQIVEDCRQGINNSTACILICLEYINKMESLLLQCNERDARVVVEGLKTAKNRIVSGDYGLEYEFLRVLVK